MEVERQGLGGARDKKRLKRHFTLQGDINSLCNFTWKKMNTINIVVGEITAELGLSLSKLVLADLSLHESLFSCYFNTIGDYMK